MKFVIEGGKKLGGTIKVNGSKNTALKLLSASLLARGPVTLHNIPEVADVESMLVLMRDLGADVHCKDHTCTINPGQLVKSEIDPEISKRFRASIMLAVPLFTRTGTAVFPHPGGDVIGERPIDVFLDGYRAFGATVAHTQKLYTILGTDLHPATFVLPVISVQGTEGLMMLATQIPGTSKLQNAACEPEIEALADFLNACGAHITGAGTPTITIEGGKEFTAEAVDFTNPSDRIEAGSLIILGIAANSDLMITNMVPSHLDVPLAYLRKMGAHIEIGEDFVRTVPNSELQAVSLLKTHEYPGFPTDLQSPMVVLMTQVMGQSIMQETVYEGRLAWTEELKRMGADILNLDNFRVAVTGPTPLRGRTAESLDIRAGMAYLIAGLLAQGTSTINGIEKIDRGYERIEERLRAIGADITRT
ncbi:MAG: UDP-N-acetylglucosamine 1-carboxyvinyltransferase [Patescibacteria group bacterium]